MLKITHRKIVVHVVVCKNACAFRIKQMFGAGVYFLDIPRATYEATLIVVSVLPFFLFFSKIPSWSAFSED